MTPALFAYSAVVSGALAALIGVAVNAPRAVELGRRRDLPVRTRAQMLAAALVIVPAVWASFGVAASPIPALVAAWISWSF